MFTTNVPSNCADAEDAPGPNADTADYLTRQAAANLLGTTLSDLRQRIRLGEIATIKMGDVVLVKRASLERFLAPIQLAGERVFRR
jgi:excisionase family DNA binding protein